MKSVLIVDDAEFMRGSLRCIFERNGYQVVGEANNGATALIKYCKLKPDIVTMDITMPEMDGLEALKEIMKIDPLAKVIMISAIDQKLCLTESIRHGARGFIVKPFNEDEIVRALGKL